MDTAASPGIQTRSSVRTLTLVNQSVEDCLISGYESLIPTIELPDPTDRHVLAAAIVGEANLIITFNLSDFPPERLEPFELEARHPDTFVQRLIESEPEVKRGHPPNFRAPVTRIRR